MYFRTSLYLLVFFGLWNIRLNAQQPDSLSNISFDELYNHSKNLMLVEKETLKALPYFEAYKQKAIRENDTERLVNIYRSMAIWQTELEPKIAYADSAIHIARNSGDNGLIGNALYTKAVVYFKHNHWDKVIEYYLKADHYISKTDNKYFEHKVKYAIFQAKYTLGNYEEALPIIQQCVSYFGQHNDDHHHQLGYLNSLHGLGVCLNRMGKYAECSEVNQTGFEKAVALSKEEMTYPFSSSEGINQYSTGNYQQALEYLEPALSFFTASDNKKQQAITSFFIGKSLIEMNKSNMAIPYFEKVDSIFAQTGYLRSDMAENYVFLINDAKRQKDLKKELYYTNRFLEADQMLHNQYKDIAVGIHKDYDTKKLQESKAHIEKLLGQKEANNKWLTVFLLTALTGIILLSARYVYYRKKFKKLYKQFIDNRPALTLIRPVEPIPDSTQQEIKEELVNKILKKLERFESNKGFTKQNLTLSKLARDLKTNPKYLSKIIAEHKHKEYLRYINDLRINHLMELLKTKKLTEYTIEALAKEIGYSSAKGFNTVFYNTTGMKFSGFLKEFRKDHKESYSPLSELKEQRAV